MRTKHLIKALLLVSVLFGSTSLQARTIRLDDAERKQVITVTPVTADIFRVQVVPSTGEVNQLPSLVLDEMQNSADADVKVSDVGNGVQIFTTSSGMMAIVDNTRKSVSFSCGDTFYVGDMCYRDGAGLVLRHDGEQSFYGGGEKGKALNLSGDTLLNYNKQNYGYTLGGDKNINQMGITMPFVISSKGYGIFIDDFCKSTMVVGEKSIEYQSTSPAPLTYYVINGAGRVENVVKQFTALVGRQDLPPLWTLGYITSKYGYHDQAETEGVIDTLKRAGYPVDGIVLDLYWYGKEQDMGRLEWDKTQWPDHRAMLRDLKAKGVNVVTISQPYILTNGRGVDNYNELNSKGLLCKDGTTGKSQDVTIWVGEGGMFDVSNPDTRLWLRNRYKQLTEEGVTGWWGDLGEPEVHPLTVVHHNGLTAEQYHNVYGNDWSKIIYDLFKEDYPNERLMTMMRAGTAGLQRYSVFPWSTDVSRSWGGLAPQVNIMLNSGLSGLGYMSHDVGGFAVDPENPRDGELYIRWLQLGLFSPVLRTHSQAIAEPYKYEEFGDLTLRIIRERYRWLPYNYTLAYENASQGLPLVRPLGFYDSDNYMPHYDYINDQFLWGHDVMVAPVMTQGATSRSIRFPEGTWVDFNNPSRRYQGYRTFDYDAPIDVLPLFVRAGAFIPMATGEMQNVGDYNPDNLVIYHYPDNKPSSFTLFDDDLHSTGTLAEGHHRLIRFESKPEETRCEIKVQAEGTFAGASLAKDYTLVLQGMQINPSAVKVNGMAAEGANYDSDAMTLTIPLHIADINNATVVTIEVSK